MKISPKQLQFKIITIYSIPRLQNLMAGNDPVIIPYEVINIRSMPLYGMITESLSGDYSCASYSCSETMFQHTCSQIPSVLVSGEGIVGRQRFEDCVGAVYHFFKLRKIAELSATGLVVSFHLSFTSLCKVPRLLIGILF